MLSSKITNLIFNLKSSPEDISLIDEWQQIYKEIEKGSKQDEIMQQINSIYQLDQFTKKCSRIFIVTPSYNSEATISETINSIFQLIQTNCEIYYHIQDGKSNDNTIEIVEEWMEKIDIEETNGIRISYSSEEDSGMYDAIVKGFSTFTDDITEKDWMLWINSDDKLDSNLTQLINCIDNRFSDISFVTGKPTVVDRKKNIIRSDIYFSTELVSTGACDGILYRTIQQEGTFWRYSVWKNVNIKAFRSYKYAGDYYLWYSLSQFCKLYQTDFTTGYFHRRLGQLSTSHRDDYFNELDGITSQNERLKKFNDLNNDEIKVLIKQGNTFSLSNKKLNFTVEKIKLLLRNIDLNKVIEADIDWCKNNDIRRKKRVLNQRINNYMYLKQLDLHIEKDNNILCIKSLKRFDYDAFFNLIVDDVLEKNDKKVIEITFETSSKKNYEFIEIYEKCDFVKQVIEVDDEIDKDLVYLNLCVYMYYLLNISKINTKNVLFFADMQPCENLLCQYFNSININTITLQHGLYVEYSDINTINKINYLNQCSKYFLSWGKDTKKLINKYHPDTKVIVCGRPTLDSSIVKEKQNYITLVLDQKLFEIENKKMLKEVAKFCKSNGALLNIRFHPQLNELDYSSLGINYQKDLDIQSSLFVVGHTSSLLFEMLCFNIPVYRYSSDKPSAPFPKELTFNNFKELKEIYKNDYDFLSLSKNYISYTGHNSIIQYKNFFKNLLSVEDNRSLIKISIVTVVYNDKNGLEKTIASVRSLNYSNKEFIIIDGNSNDGTVDVLKANESVVHKYVSEQDSGIYDAMNKGINLASKDSDYIIFMNAGDEFANPDVFKNIFSNDNINEIEKYDVVYGDRNYISLNGKVTFQKAGNIDTINRRMVFGHQSVFVKREVLLNNLFNTTYKNAADYNQFVTIYKNKGKFLHVPVSVCNFYAGGASENGILPYLEVLKIQMEHFGFSDMKKNSAYLQAFRDNFSGFFDEK